MNIRELVLIVFGVLAWATSVESAQEISNGTVQGYDNIRHGHR